MKNTIVLIMLVVAFAFPGVLAQQNMTAQTSDDEAAKKADAFLAQWDKADMPGCAVAAVRDGNVIYKRAFGMANLDYDVPNSTATLFNVASVSKAFTAASVALLAHQGKLSLDDDVRKYVPELRQYDDTVTIRHLIHHTSGIREYQALVLFSGLGADNAYTDKAILDILARQKNLSFKPGAKYQYSNSGYLLLGLIVERTSGKSLRAFAEENIFRPLGMKNTRFHDNRFEVVKNRAAGYRIGPDKSIFLRTSLSDLVGAGGVLSSAEDLALWAQNFFEPKVGNKELINLLNTAGTSNTGKKINYSFGLFHNRYKGLPVIKHSGNNSGYRAQIASFPEQKFASIALCNNTAIFPSSIVEKLADIYLNGQFKTDVSIQKKPWEDLPPAIALSDKEALRYAGTYAHAESGRVFKLRIQDGKLINSEFFKRVVPVSVLSENRLVVADKNGMTDMNVVFDKGGKVAEIRIFDGNGRPDSFIPVKPPLTSPEQLAEYAGTYYSEEFAANYKVSVKGNSVAVQINESLQPTLAAWYPDFFTAADGEIRFTFSRDDKGRVNGFVFDSGLDDREVKGVAFTRR